MIKIFFLILELNYAVTIGYIPVNSVPIFELERAEEMPELFIDLETEIIINDLIFVGGRVQTNFYAQHVNNFMPYYIDYEFKTGIRWKLIEIGFSHRCMHPIITGINVFYEKPPHINYEGGYEKLYIRFSNKKPG